MLEQQTQARIAFDTLRREALDLLRQLPESGLDPTVALQRLGSFREQLRGQLSGGLATYTQGQTAVATAPHWVPPDVPNDEFPRADARRGAAPGGPPPELAAWYRQKLRNLAERTFAESPGGDGAGASNPLLAHRSILNIGPIDPGDQRLGAALREQQLVDTEVLTALLAEARRQRRTMRQMLLASGTVTLFQLASIEAGDWSALMLSELRVIDRLQVTPHEGLYRVFDPRHDREALCAILPRPTPTIRRCDDYRRHFTSAILGEPHLAATLEVLDIQGRPAVLQEWLSGLPATDWPVQAAAPGVCYKLLTQSAVGLAVAHGAGLVHGHLDQSLLLLTGDGIVKVCGVGEPPWLHAGGDADCRADLRALGRIMAGVCTPAGAHRGARTPALPKGLVAVLERLTADGDAGYADVSALLEDLDRMRGDIPSNTEAWDRLVKHVRDHGTPEALLRQSA